MNAAVRENADMVAAIETDTALGRFGEPEEIASVVAFLVSEEGRWVTGQVIERAAASSSDARLPVDTGHVTTPGDAIPPRCLSRRRPLPGQSSEKNAGRGADDAPKGGAEGAFGLVTDGRRQL